MRILICCLHRPGGKDNLDIKLIIVVRTITKKFMMINNLKLRSTLGNRRLKSLPPLALKKLDFKFEANYQ